MECLQHIEPGDRDTAKHHREHVLVVLREALDEAGITPDKIDAVAYTKVMSMMMLLSFTSGAIYCRCCHLPVAPSIVVLSGSRDGGAAGQCGAGGADRGAAVEQAHHRSEPLHRPHRDG